MDPDFEAMQTALSWYLDFEVDHGVLEKILVDDPDLGDDAVQWGWDDTVVRERLIDEVAKFFGHHWPKYGVGGDVALLEARIKTAHARYVREGED